MPAKADIQRPGDRPSDPRGSNLKNRRGSAPLVHGAPVPGGCDVPAARRRATVRRGSGGESPQRPNQLNRAAAPSPRRACVPSLGLCPRQDSPDVNYFVFLTGAVGRPANWGGVVVHAASPPATARITKIAASDLSDGGRRPNAGREIRPTRCSRIAGVLLLTSRHQ
jgi:hypothetical protein